MTQAQRETNTSSDVEGRFAAIEQEAAAILTAEGAFKVRGVYFVLESDATMARMVEAERRVAERDRSMDSYIAKGRTTREETRAHCPEMSVTEGAE